MLAFVQTDWTAGPPFIPNCTMKSGTTRKKRQSS